VCVGQGGGCRGAERSAAGHLVERSVAERSSAGAKLAERSGALVPSGGFRKFLKFGHPLCAILSMFHHFL
jgi:hypothetical protein